MLAQRDPGIGLAVVKPKEDHRAAEKSATRLDSFRPAMPLRMRGFTLLETLVALAVIGIAMAAAMRSTRFAVDTVTDLKARAAAGWVAQNLAAELRATRAFPEMGATSGRATQGRQEFLWRQEVGGTPNYSFRRVEIKVFLPERPERAVARQIVYAARQQN